MNRARPKRSRALRTRSFLPALVPVVLAATAVGMHAEVDAQEAAGGHALEADWLFQADGAPTLERVTQEIGWARDMAERIAATSAAP